MSQYLNLTNRAVRVTTTNDITFAGFSQTINGDACTILAQSAEPRVNWRIDNPLEPRTKARPLDVNPLDGCRI